MPAISSYYSHFSIVKLNVTKMELSVIDDGIYTITCTSTGSPPTTVTWMRNQVTLITSESDQGKYTSSQIVVDRRLSTYDNILTIKGDDFDALGNYTCNISNSIRETFAKKNIDTIDGM